MGYEHRALDPQKRRAAKALVVEALANPGNAGAHEKVAERSPGRPFELSPEHVEDEARQALEELDRDIADRRVADDDIGRMVRQILALGVADEAQRTGLDELGRLLHARLALAAFLADRQQGHGRIGDSEDLLGKDRAHVRVLIEVQPARVRRGADVEQHHGPLVGDHLDGQSRTVDALEAAQEKDGRCDAGTGVAGRDHGIGLAFLDKAHAHVDGRVAFAAHGGSGVLVHGYRLRGLDDAHVGRPVGADEGHDPRLVANEDDVGLRVAACPVNAANDDLFGGVVATHRVNGNANASGRDRLAGAQDLEVHGYPPCLTPRPVSSRCGLGRCLRVRLGLDAHGLAAVVPAAVVACVVGALLGVAMRALFELRCAERVMRAPVALARVRDAPLGNSHVVTTPRSLVGLVGIAPLGQSSQPRIDRSLVVAVLTDGVEIGAAHRTQAAAVGPAE